MQILLRGYLAYDLTRRESALGLVYLGFGLAMLVATPWGGVAADRLAKRAVLVWSQGVLAVVALALGVVVAADALELWMLVVASIVQGLAFGFFGPARVSFTSELVGRDRLGNAITLSLLSLNGTRVLAPSLAGVLIGIAAIGPEGVYFIAAALSVAALGLLLRTPRISPAGSERRPLAELVDGIHHVRDNRRLALVVGTSFVVIMFGFNYFAFLPALVEDEFGLGPGWLGLLMGATSVGAVLAAVPVAGRADRIDGGRWLVRSGLVMGVSVAALGVSPTFALGFVAGVATGASTTVFQSITNTLALRLSADAYQGRVQSLMMLSFAGFGIAALPLGALAEAIGLRQAIVAMGAVTALATAVYAVLARRLVPAAALRPAPVSPGG